MFYSRYFKRWNIKSSSVDLILTSPPFAFSTKFYINNWIRYWFGGWGIEDFEKESFNYLEKNKKKTLMFMTIFLKNLPEF